MEINFLHESFHASWSNFEGTGVIYTEKSWACGLDTTFSSVNPQTKICPTKLVMKITLFEQKKKFEQRKNSF